MLPRKPPSSWLTRRTSAPEAPDQVDAFAAHPVGHEYVDRVTERPTQRGERDAGVAARGLGDRCSASERSGLVAAHEDVEGHAILDAAREVQVLGLRVDASSDAAVGKVDAEQRRVADKMRQAERMCGRSRDRAPVSPLPRRCARDDTSRAALRCAPVRRRARRASVDVRASVLGSVGDDCGPSPASRRARSRGRCRRRGGSRGAGFGRSRRGRESSGARGTSPKGRDRRTARRARGWVDRARALGR